MGNMLHKTKELLYAMKPDKNKKEEQEDTFDGRHGYQGEAFRSEFVVLWSSQSSSFGLRRAAMATASAVCLHSTPPSERTVSS